jgi:hypothetical protein
MRIHGLSGSATLAASASTRRAAAPGGFKLFEGQAPPAANAPGSAGSVGGIDALIALQAFEDTGERRRRAVRRGRTALDALDALKLALLGGTLPEGALVRLQIALDDLKESSGDPKLDAILGEIELRVAVELAKFRA